MRCFHRHIPLAGRSCRLPVSDRRNDRRNLPPDHTLPIMQMTCLRGGTMTNIILCDVTASVSELKNDPVASAGAGCGYSVAIIDSNRPVFLLCARGSVGKNARSSGRKRPGAIDNRTSKPIYFVIGQRDKRHHSGDTADEVIPRS